MRGGAGGAVRGAAATALLGAAGIGDAADEDGLGAAGVCLRLVLPNGLEPDPLGGEPVEGSAWGCIASGGGARPRGDRRLAGGAKPLQLVRLGEGQRLRHRGNAEPPRGPVGHIPL